MRRLMYSLLLATMSLGLNAAHAQSRAAQKDELDSRVQSVNDLADRRGGMKDAMHTVSVETGVPLDQIQKMRDRHPDAGAAGIMIACTLADNTKGSPESYLSRHINGKGWAAIARENNVPLDKLNVRLDRLEHDLNAKDLTPSGRDHGRVPRY